MYRESKSSQLFQVHAEFSLLILRAGRLMPGMNDQAPGDIQLHQVSSSQAPIKVWHARPIKALHSSVQHVLYTLSEVTDRKPLKRTQSAHSPRLKQQTSEEAIQKCNAWDIDSVSIPNRLRPGAIRLHPKRCWRMTCTPYHKVTLFLFCFVFAAFVCFVCFCLFSMIQSTMSSADDSLEMFLTLMMFAETCAPDRQALLPNDCQQPRSFWILFDIVQGTNFEVHQGPHSFLLSTRFVHIVTTPTKGMQPCTYFYGPFYSVFICRQFVMFFMNSLFY